MLHCRYSRQTDTKHCIHIAEVIGSVLQQILFQPDFVFITIWLTKDSFTSSSLFLSSPHHKTANALSLWLFPTITMFQKCTLLGRWDFQSILGYLAFRPCRLQQSYKPPTSSWTPSASPQLLQDSVVCVYISLCVHIQYKVSSTVDHVNIYHTHISTLIQCTNNHNRIRSFVTLKISLAFLPILRASNWGVKCQH